MGGYGSTDESIARAFRAGLAAGVFVREAKNWVDGGNNDVATEEPASNVTSLADWRFRRALQDAPQTVLRNYV